jgi:hypothetical protein
MPINVPNPITRRCSFCRGAGKVEVGPVSAATLRLLARQRGEVSGAALARQDGCKATTMNNRLAALERMGLATSRTAGRLRLYRATGGRS